MALSVLDNKLMVPEDNELTAVLGPLRECWDAVRAFAAKSCTDINEEWKFYSQKSGWGLVVKSKKRTIFYLYPNKGCFIVVLVLGERAVKAAEEAMPPGHIQDAIKNAQPYAEGCSIHIEVRDSEELEYIKKLIEIKLQN